MSSGRDCPTIRAVVTTPRCSVLKLLGGLEQPGESLDDATETPALIVVPGVFDSHRYGRGSWELRLCLRPEEQSREAPWTHECVTHRRHVVLPLVVLYEHGLTQQVAERHAQSA
ncbi:hypothetical protein OHU25_32400 [Streptomyces sp. NBC_00117]|uniref:hypothetical protein n=1 Tax=unclassified Streptomyces TaxID=2593676 RepID=UPI00324A970C